MDHTTKTEIDGLHQTVYWVKKNPKYEEEKRAGVKQKASRYTTAKTYVGEWSHNKRCGFGTMTMKNRYKYEGQWKDNLREGSGTLWAKNKAGKMVKRYCGDWYRDQFHGKGVFYYPNGDRYEGMWKNHQRHGKGTMEYANGDIFEGSWEDGVRSGIGVLLYANGDRYEGSFRDGVKEGMGRHYYIKSKKIYDGEWHKDMAKCGVYSDMPKEFDCEPEKSSGENYTIRLPSLELADSDGVLNHAVRRVQESRDYDDFNG